MKQQETVNMRVLSNTNSVNYGQTTAISNLLKFKSDNYPLSDSILLSISDNPKDQTSFILNYEIDDNFDIKEYKDYNFSSMMYDRRYGYFYLSPAKSESHVPLIDAKKLLELCINEVTNIQTDIPKGSLDEFFVQIKLAEVEADVSVIDMLSKVVNNSRADNNAQPTILGRLLYGSKQPSSTTNNNINLTDAQYRRIMSKFNKFVSGFIKCIVNFFADTKTFYDIMTLSGPSTLEAKVPILDSVIVASITLKEVVNSTEYSNIMEAPNDNADFTTELSTNYLFNTTTREYLSQMIDLSTKNHVKKGKPTNDAEKVLSLSNQVDLITTNTKGSYSNFDELNLPNFFDLGVSSDSLNDVDTLKDAVKQSNNLNNYGGILRNTRKLSSYINFLRNRKDTDTRVDTVIKNLNNIENSGEDLINPNLFILNTMNFKLFDRSISEFDIWLTSIYF